LQNAELDQTDNSQSMGKWYSRLSSVSVVFVVLFSIMAILVLVMDIWGTHQDTKYICETCGTIRRASEHYFLRWRYFATQKNVSKTRHTEIFEKSGLKCDEHQWRRHFTSSQGFLGGYDGPIGDYGFFALTDAEKAKILSEVASCATKDEKIRCIWRLRYERNGLSERLVENK